MSLFDFKNVYLLCIAMLFQCGQLHAANDLNPEISQTLAALNQHATVRYDFEQNKKITLLKKPLISHGKMIYDKHHGLYLEYTTPVWTAYLLTDNKIFEKTRRDGHYKKLTLAQNSGISQIIKSIVSADIEQLQRYFAFNFQKLNPDWELALMPRNNTTGKTLKNIIIQGNDYIDTLQFNESSGDTTTLNFAHNNASQLPLTAKEKQYFVQ